MDLTKIPQAKFWTLEDALKQIPGIEIKNDGIFYHGEPVASLKENGFTSTDMQQNLASNLKRPASDFSNIDLKLMDLTSLNGGVSLNFTRVKVEAGVWGNLMGTTGLITQNFNGRISIKQNNHLLEISPRYSLTSTPQSTGEAQMQYAGSDAIIKTRSVGDMSVRGGGIDLRYDYSTSKHVLNLTGVYSANRVGMEQQTSGDTSQSDNLAQTQSSDFTVKNKGHNLSFTAGYNWTINKNSKLYAFLNGEYPISDNGTSSRTLNLQSGMPNYDRNQHTSNGNYYGVVSYNLKTKKIGNIEAGSKYFYRGQKVNTNYINNVAFNDSSTNSYYRNTYNYGAVFGSWAKTFGSTSINASLTADYSEDRIPSYDNEVYSYFTLYPHLALFREFDGHSIRLTSSHREKRPRINSLNPIADPIMTASGLMIKKGNPNLKTVKESLIAVDYSAVWLKKMQTDIGLSYTYSSGGIESVYYALDTILFQSFLNLSNQQEINCDLQFQYPLTKRLRGSFSATVSPSAVQAFPDSSVVWYQSYSGDLRLDYEVIKNCMQLSIQVNYSKSEQYQSSESGIWRTSINATYRKKDWFFSLSIMNPVQPTITSRTKHDAIGYISNYTTTRRQFDASLRVGYQFGKAKNAKSVKSVIVDDM